VRFAVPLLAALAMITLVACGGDDDDTAAVPTAQRFVTEEDAPGSKPDPDETRQTAVDFDAFLAGLSELAVDPDTEEATAIFEEAGFKGAGVDTRSTERRTRRASRLMSSARLSSLSLLTGRRACSTGLRRTRRSHAP
jgi:hypothetical protein